MVGSKTGAAGIGEAETRFADEGRSIGRTAVRNANARPTIIMAIAAFVLAGGGRAQGAAGNIPALRNPDKLYPLKPGANGDLVYEAPRFVAVVAPDGTVTFQDRGSVYPPRRATFGFARELTHWTSSPYAEADFLAATFKRRTAMAANVSSQQMRAAQLELPTQLDALWADTRYQRRERRRIIFLLWRELETVEANGRSAATTIEAWVRKRLPRGSPDGYGDQELAAYFRENQNEPAFSPYGFPLEMRWPPSP